jgi:hypothetical protein
MRASSPDRHVLRCQFTDIPNRIVTAICIYPSSIANTTPLITKGIWDTGAQKSIITPYVAKKLNLQPIDQLTISGVTGKSPADIVVITLEIPDHCMHKNLEVAVCPFNTDPKSDVNVLIGMDIIAQGDFVLSNGDGYTLFSFAVPPSITKIDLSALP